jgi:hypothetical protein
VAGASYRLLQLEQEHREAPAVRAVGGQLKKKMRIRDNHYMQVMDTCIKLKALHFLGVASVYIWPSYHLRRRCSWVWLFSLHSCNDMLYHLGLQQVVLERRAHIRVLLQAGY